VLWTRPDLARLPALAIGVDVARALLGHRRDVTASRKALARLRACFEEAGEPDLVAIFSAVSGAEELRPIRTAVAWSERFQRGMLTRESYYAGMRRFLERHASAA